MSLTARWFDGLNECGARRKRDVVQSHRQFCTQARRAITQMAAAVCCEAHWMHLTLVSPLCHRCSHGCMRRLVREPILLRGRLLASPRHVHAPR